MEKMRTIKNYVMILATVVAVLGACKKGETGPAGKDGANGTNGIVPMSTDGFIKGNIVGTRKDGTPFNEPFDFRNYWGTPSGTLDSNTTNNYKFDISRGEDIFGDNYATITINTSSTTATTGTLSNIYVSFTKSLGVNKQFKFTSSASNAVPVSGLSYNPTSGLFTGSFTYTLGGIQNSTGNLATISGSFQATITRIYNKTSISNTEIKD